jgi:hypothetical protein
MWMQEGDFKKLGIFGIRDKHCLKLYNVTYYMRRETDLYLKTQLSISMPNSRALAKASSASVY